MADLITLILPHDAAAADARLPALETLLARAEREMRAAPWWQSDTDNATLSELPLAAYGYLGAGGEPANDYWLCAEPAHLVADQDQVYLAAYGADLALTMEEAAALTAEFNALYGSEGWQLYAPGAERWYLRTPQAARISTTPPAAALGYAVRPLLPRGEDAMQWHAFLTEVEMLFHASAVNARRREQGLPVISGLWLWGGGVLPARTELPWDTVQGIDNWLRGMARHGARRWQELAPDASTLIPQSGRHLVVFEPRHALSDLEQQWFAPLLQALKTGRVQQLELHLEHSGTAYRLGRAQLRRWWRRRQPWPQHVPGSP